MLAEPNDALFWFMWVALLDKFLLVTVLASWPEKHLRKVAECRLSLHSSSVFHSSSTRSTCASSFVGQDVHVVTLIFRHTFEKY